LVPCKIGGESLASLAAFLFFPFLKDEKEFQTFPELGNAISGYVP